MESAERVEFPSIPARWVVGGFPFGLPSGDCGKVTKRSKAVHERSQEEGRDDFTSQEGCFLAVQAVFRVVREFVSEGEIEDLRLTLPEELRVLLDD